MGGAASLQVAAAATERFIKARLTPSKHVQEAYSAAPNIHPGGSRASNRFTAGTSLQRPNEAFANCFLIGRAAAAPLPDGSGETQRLHDVILAECSINPGLTYFSAEWTY